MLISFFDSAYHLPPLFAALLSLGLLTLVLLKGDKTFSTKIFCLLIVSVMLTSLSIFGMRLSPDTYTALLWDKAVPVIAYGTFIFYYHFALAYSKGGGQKHILRAGYMLWGIFILFAPTNLIVKEMRLEYYGYAPVVGPLTPLLFISYIALAIGAIRTLFKARTRSTSYVEKNRMTYLAIAGVFPIVGATLDAFSPLPPMSLWGYLVFCSLCTVAILKYHLMDVYVFFRVGTIYLVTSMLIAIPYVAILYFLNFVLKLALQPWWIHVIIILLLAIFLRPIYSKSQHWVDRLFYRDRYDYLLALHELSQETQSIMDVEALATKIVTLVRGALRVSNVNLLLTSENESGFCVVSSVGSEVTPSGVILRNNSPLVKWLANNGILLAEKLDIIPQLQSFSHREKHMLEAMAVKIYAPLKNRQGYLCGIMVLGEKLSQQAYSDEDIKMLETVTNEMAIAIDNARLYEEAKKSTEMLRTSEQKLRLSYDSMTTGIAVLDPRGTIIELNKAMVHMCGYRDKKGLIGRSLFEFITETCRTVAEKQIALTLNDGQATIIEIGLLREDGKEILTTLGATVLKDIDGNHTGVVAVVEDITERRRAEERERELERELNMSRRLASIGELAAGVAHEINNPLTGIIGFSQRVLRKSTDEIIKRDLERIYEDACRAARVVENLRTFARQSPLKKELLDINDILQKALEMRIYELRTSNIKVETDLSPRLPKVSSDFHQIQQVFLNIIVNAEQAMNEAKKGGRLRIQTEEENDCVKIVFTDNGPGISKENLDKLFHPFFTTRGDKGGTGLGLSICHGIITEHGGKINVKSELGYGSTFIVKLPIGKKKANNKVLDE